MQLSSNLVLYIELFCLILGLGYLIIYSIWGVTNDSIWRLLQSCDVNYNLPYVYCEIRDPSYYSNSHSILKSGKVAKVATKLGHMEFYQFFRREPLPTEPEYGNHDIQIYLIRYKLNGSGNAILEGRIKQGNFDISAIVGRIKLIFMNPLLWGVFGVLWSIVATVIGISSFVESNVLTCKPCSP